MLSRLDFFVFGGFFPVHPGDHRHCTKQRYHYPIDRSFEVDLVRQPIGCIHDKIGEEKLDARKCDNEMERLPDPAVNSYLYQSQVDVARRDVTYKVGDKADEKGQKDHYSKVAD